MDETMDQACPDDTLAAVLDLAADDEPGALARIAALVEAHPADPRLHFLAGSLLAAQARYEEAQAAMARSIEIEPGYAIARFQLGLLELSSGDAAAADLTLQPLAEAEADDALVLFARGLRHLARDELLMAVDMLSRGIKGNRDHPLVSRDMELIIDRIREGGETPAQPEPEPEVSATQMLLRQHAAKPTKH